MLQSIKRYIVKIIVTRHLCKECQRSVRALHFLGNVTNCICLSNLVQEQKKNCVWVTVFSHFGISIA